MHACVSVGIAVGSDAGAFGLTHTPSVHTITAAHQGAALVLHVCVRIGYHCREEEDGVTQ